MKWIHGILGIVCTFCIIIILLFTSVEAVVYWTPGFFETEYEKYQVPQTVEMEMDDLMEVTREMMTYLRGDRDDLHIMTTVAKQPREFFNQREIDHMADVRNLFLSALQIRRICAFLALAFLAALIFLKARIRRVLPASVCAGTGLFFIILAVIGGIISTDFTKYFIVFHHLLFTNDLWILDPETSLLINIVPEGFFMDTALRIGLVFGASISVLFLAGLLPLIIRRKRLRNPGK